MSDRQFVPLRYEILSRPIARLEKKDNAVETFGSNANLHFDIIFQPRHVRRDANPKMLWFHISCVRPKRFASQDGLMQIELLPQQFMHVR